MPRPKRDPEGWLDAEMEASRRTDRWPPPERLVGEILGGLDARTVRRYRKEFANEFAYLELELELWRLESTRVAELMSWELPHYERWLREHDQPVPDRAEWAKRYGVDELTVTRARTAAICDGDCGHSVDVMSLRDRLSARPTKMSR